MKTLLTLAIFALTIMPAMAQKIKDTDVPTAVKDALKKQHPNAEVEKWEKEDGNYEAEIEEGKSEMSLTFDASGNLLETEVEIKTSDLPASVSNYVHKNFPGKKIKEVSKITLANGTLNYEVEIDKTEYIFDSNGTLLKKDQKKEDDDDDKD